MKRSTTKLTDELIRGLPENGPRQTIRDAELIGLCIRLPQFVWAFEYRPNGGGAVRSATIGRFPQFKEAAARARAMQLAHAIKFDGRDPVAEKIAARTAAVVRVKAQTFGELLAEGGVYETAIGWKAKCREAIRTLRRHYEPVLGLRPAELTQAHIVAPIMTVFDSGKYGAADDLEKFINSFLEFCAQRPHLTNVQRNVLADWSKPERPPKPVTDEDDNGRALTDAELVAVWQAAKQMKGAGQTFGGVVQLGLLTGMRVGEITGLMWEDIASDRIVLPASRTKMRKKHAVLLTPLMREIIGQQRTVSQYVFAAPMGGVHADLSEQVSRVRKASGVDFKTHDMRKTVRTRLSKLGFSEEIGCRVVGQAVGNKIAKIYNENDFWSERAEAVTKLSDHVAAVLGKNVIKFAA
jgi:integrase